MFGCPNKNYRTYLVIVAASHVDCVSQRANQQLDFSRLFQQYNVALVEKVLDKPSLVFQLNPTIILDMLLESQIVLRSCIVVIEKYRQVGQQKGVDSAGKEQAF